MLSFDFLCFFFSTVHFFSKGRRSIKFTKNEYVCEFSFLAHFFSRKNLESIKSRSDEEANLELKNELNVKCV